MLKETDHRCKERRCMKKERDMSFSSDLKKELGQLIDAPRHCRIAELAALTWFLASAGKESGALRLDYYSGNPYALNAAAELISRLFKKKSGPVQEKASVGSKKYTFSVTDPDICENLVKTIKCRENEMVPEAGLLIQKECCKRAFLRGAFLSAGTVNDPGTSYNFEINCRSPEQAEILAEVFSSLHIRAKTTKRGRYYSLYNKESEQVSDLIGLMGARVGLLELENTKIYKSMRGSVNRKVNCETANINKAANASAKQIEDIRLIREKQGLETLSAGLDEIARLRLEYPEATLKELGELMDPPVGKSGVNHRLRKLSSLAEGLRAAEGSENDIKKS